LTVFLGAAFFGVTPDAVAVIASFRALASAFTSTPTAAREDLARAWARGESALSDADSIDSEAAARCVGRDRSAEGAVDLDGEATDLEGEATDLEGDATDLEGGMVSVLDRAVSPMIRLDPPMLERRGAEGVIGFAFAFDNDEGARGRDCPTAEGALDLTPPAPVFEATEGARVRETDPRAEGGLDREIDLDTERGGGLFLASASASLWAHLSAHLAHRTPGGRGERETEAREELREIARSTCVAAALDNRWWAGPPLLVVVRFDITEDARLTSGLPGIDRRGDRPRPCWGAPPPVPLPPPPTCPDIPEAGLLLIAVFGREVEAAEGGRGERIVLRSRVGDPAPWDDLSPMPPPGWEGVRDEVEAPWCRPVSIRSRVCGFWWWTPKTWGLMTRLAISWWSVSRYRRSSMMRKRPPSSS
jgi:hypothetical protein